MRMGGRYSTAKIGFFGTVFPPFLLLLHSTPGSHTREESKIAPILMLKMGKIGFCSPTNYRVSFPGSGANVGASRHLRLAIGITALDQHKDLHPLSIRGQGPNRWAVGGSSHSRERTIALVDPRALPGTYTHTHQNTHTTASQSLTLTSAINH